MARGEIVVLIAGAAAASSGRRPSPLDAVLGVLLGELPLAQAARLAAKLPARVTTRLTSGRCSCSEIPPRNNPRTCVSCPARVGQTVAVRGTRMEESPGSIGQGAR